MKIALIAPDALSTIIFTKTFSRILNDKDNIAVFTISSVDDYSEEIKNLGTIHYDLKMERYINIKKDIQYFFKLLKIMKKESFDAVVTFTTKPNIYGVIAAKVSGANNIVMAIRGLGRVFGQPKNRKDLFFKFILTAFYKISAKFSKIVWFTNKYDMNYFRENNIITDSQVFLTKNAVDINDFSLKNIDKNKLKNLRSELDIRDNDKIIIMVARLIWSKGVKEFCESAINIYKNNKNIKFILIAPEEPGVEDSVPLDFINETKLKSNMIWLGFRKDVRELYAISNISVLPSYYPEGGYPRAILEAMAYEKPVIAGDTDVCRGPVEDGKNGYIVPVKDSQILTKKILDIVMDEEKMERFGKYSRKIIIKKFDDRLVFQRLYAKLSK